MCGILAVLNTSKTEDELVPILERIEHRGPDDQGTYLKNGIFLGHQRLSIVDLETGKQPLDNENGTKHLICNGEIYNHQKLRQKMKNHHFKTDSDSEVILHLYEEYGPSFVSMLDGMFSFALTDGENLFVARDPIGIKPLYYGKSEDGSLFFASEMKCLVDQVVEFKEFPAGHYYDSRKGFQAYYTPGESLNDKQLNPLTDLDEITTQIRELVTRSVEEQLMADVPIGFFLSGGLDSSLVTAIAARKLGGKNIKTYSAGIVGYPAEDLPAARKVAEYLGTDHHEVLFTVEEAMEVLPEVVYHVESFDPMQVKCSLATYFVAKEAVKDVKVALVGEGADELFAGYVWSQNSANRMGLDRAQQVLIDEIKSLAYLNLHRVDRISMAHSMEVRPPFLKTELVDFALRIPMEMKLYGKPQIEKWILRKSFEGYLPDEILWRKKAGFTYGSGAWEAIGERIESIISESDFRKQQNMVEPSLRSQAELYFYTIFSRQFPHSSALSAVWRWDQEFGEHLSNTQLVKI